MNNDHLDITVLIDRSGSMARIKTDMEGSFRAFLDNQRQQPGKTTISLHQFNTEYGTNYTAIPVKDAGELTLLPNGGTALFDSMAKCIRETGARLAAMPENLRPGKVLFVAITDGEENSSVETTADALRAIVQHQREVYKWEFVYLGANQDAFKTAAAMGIANAANYNATPRGTRSAVRGMCANVNAYRAAPIGSPAPQIQVDENEKELTP